MSRRLLTILFFALLCIVVIVYVSNKTEKKPEFSLLSIVPERQVVGHLNLLSLLEDSKTINRQLKWGISFNFYLSQVEKQLLNSGLNLESTYFTHSDALKETALYLEIQDQEKCNRFAKDILDFYDLKSIDSVNNTYVTEKQNASIQFSEKHVILKWGSLVDNQINSSTKNAFRDSLLSTKNKLYFNPQGKDTIHKDEYSQISYSLDSSLNITGSWFVENGHPFKRAQDSISIYPSTEKKWFIALNIDPKQLKNYQNEWLEEKYDSWIQKLDFDQKEFRDYWNGIMSLQFGGETTIEKVTVKTVFDENFNQIEEREVTKTSVKDFGLVVGSHKPKEMLSFIKKQSNVKVKGSETYFPLSPPLKETLLGNLLLLSSGNKDLSKLNSDEIITVQGEFLKFWIEIHSKINNEKQFDFKIEVGKSKQANINT